MPSRRLCGRTLAGLALVLTSLAFAEESASRLRIVSFNVLAPLWASPVWYPDDIDTSLLGREFRRGRIEAFLGQVRQGVDVVCLQEVEQGELPFFLAALGPEFAGAMAINGPDYWSDYLVDDPWVPNGNAVAIRKSAVVGPQFADLETANGNHAAAVTAIHAASGALLRVYSVHLDSDRTSKRTRELRGLFEQAPAWPGSFDVVCGDINEDTQIGTASGIFSRAGFVDVLASVGNREATHPWSTTYYKATRWAVIDHILVRGATPEAGEVLDLGSAAITDELTRIEENLRRSGSDHYPISGTVRYQPP